MIEYETDKDLVVQLDKLAELLASASKMTIYHGFKGGQPMPFREAEDHMSQINNICSEVGNILSKQQDSDSDNVKILINMYVNRLKENTIFLGEVTEKLKQQANGSKKYGFFKFRSDSKEWERNTKKLINVRSNLELFMRNA